jgi:hypothetical protein
VDHRLKQRFLKKLGTHVDLRLDYPNRAHWQGVSKPRPGSADDTTLDGILPRRGQVSGDLAICDRGWLAWAFLVRSHHAMKIGKRASAIELEWLAGLDPV